MRAEARRRPRWVRVLLISATVVGACLVLFVVLAVIVALTSPGIPSSSPVAQPTTSAPPPAVAPPSVQAPAVSPSVPPVPRATSPATRAAGPPPLGSVCGEFQAFFADLTTNTPRSPTLRSEAERVQAAGHRTSGQLSQDADALVGDVERPDFPTEGNALDPPIQALSDECP